MKYTYFVSYHWSGPDNHGDGWGIFEQSSLIKNIQGVLTLCDDIITHSEENVSKIVPVNIVLLDTEPR